MPFLLIRDLPRYECLLEAAKLFPDLDPSACEASLHLMRAADETFKLLDSHLAGHNLSEGRFMVMLLLFDKLHGCPHPRTPAELAGLSRVTRSTMTGLIDTLERDGLVTREPDVSDRRMMLVTLTTKGRALLEMLLPPHFKLMAGLMQQLDETERRTLVRLLAKIMQQAGVLAGAATGAPAPVPA